MQVREIHARQKEGEEGTMQALTVTQVAERKRCHSQTVKLAIDQGELDTAVIPGFYKNARPVLDNAKLAR